MMHFGAPVLIMLNSNLVTSQFLLCSTPAIWEEFTIKEPKPSKWDTLTVTLVASNMTNTLKSEEDSQQNASKLSRNNSNED